MAQKEKENQEKAAKLGKPAKETAKKEEKPKSCGT
jgi:hypothetical protein